MMDFRENLQTEDKEIYELIQKELKRKDIITGVNLLMK